MKRAAAKKKPRSPKAASVRAYIAALPDWQRVLAARFDRLVRKVVPRSTNALIWGLPFYGVRRRGWFVSCGGFPTCVKFTFFKGASLRPLPPTGKGRQLRWLDVGRDDRFDEKRLASWIRQAAALPGFGSS